MPPDEEAPPAASPTKSPRKPLRPLPVFLALLLLALGIAAAARMISFDGSADATSDISTATPSSRASVTEDEAKEIFASLHRRLLKAYRTRDTSLAKEITATGSKIRMTVVAEIRELSREGVRPHPNFDTRNVEVLSIGMTEIQLRQTLISRARFFSETGDDVTEGGRTELQEKIWILDSESDGLWRLSRSTIVSASPLRDD